MTIMVDDTGTGDLLGNAFIVFWRRETNEFMVKTIPLECYQAADFNEKSKQAVKQHFIDAIEQLIIPPTEEIQLCQGSIFDDARVYLTEKKFTFQSVKIEGEFQDRVEDVYITYVNEEFGVPKERLPKEGGKDRFFALYDWIIQDYPRRSRFVKSGFEKWQTRWAEEAQKAWMQLMVSTKNRNELESDIEDGSEDTSPSDHLSTGSSDQRHGHPKRRTPSGQRKGFQKRSSAPKGGRRKMSNPTKGRPKQYSQDGRRRSQDKKYSSTDPDPRRKFF